MAGSPVADALVQLKAAIDALAADDVVGSVRDELLVLEVQRARLEAQIARRMAHFDSSGEWALSGSRSAAAYLAGRTRAHRAEMGYRLRVAKQCAALPEVSAAWQAGRITTRHANVIADARHAAKADAEFDEFAPELLRVARVGTPGDVADVAKQWREALDDHLDRDGSDKEGERLHEARALHFSESLAGVGHLDGSFDAEGAAIVKKALETAYEQAHVAKDPRTPAQQRADALVAICHAFLGGQTGRGNLPHVLVVSDVETLLGEAVRRAELASGTRLPAETVRRMACDAFVQHVLVDGEGVPLMMGRATRTFTPDQVKAMVLRDGGCRGPDCDVGPEHCEAHHLDEWARDEGLTDLDKGALFCRGVDHRRLHEGGWTVSGDANGTLEFRDRDGNLMGTSEPRRPLDRFLTRQGKEAERARERVRELVAAGPGVATPAA